MQKLSQKTQGIVYVLIAAFGFSLMSMFVKLAGDLPSFEKAFFRNFVALIFIVILMLRSHTSFLPARRNLPALFGRCARRIGRGRCVYVCALSRRARGKRQPHRVLFLGILLSGLPAASAAGL